MCQLYADITHTKEISVLWQIILFSYKGTAAGLAQGGWAGSHPKLAPYYRRIRQLVRFGSPWKIPLHLHPAFSQTRDIPQFTTSRQLHMLYESADINTSKNTTRTLQGIVKAYQTSSRYLYKTLRVESKSLCLTRRPQLHTLQIEFCHIEDQ